MKISIIGGTGKFGSGLVFQWAKQHDIIIGSRSLEKAEKVAEQFRTEAFNLFKQDFKGTITGKQNMDAVVGSDIIILSIPYESITDICRALKPSIKEDQIIVSPIVPMQKTEKSWEYIPPIYIESSSRCVRLISAAEMVANELQPAGRVLSALHTVPAKKLKLHGKIIDVDALICGDDTAIVDKFAKVVSEIPGVRPVYVGPLHTSLLVESTTPMILNIAMYGGIKEPSVKIL